jgi:glycosyltransferase involved in cell wall biosynthesis
LQICWIDRVKIVHFSTSDSEGGSARSARRIHETLRRLGHRSHMLVGTKVSHDPDAATVHGGGTRRILDRIADDASRRVGLPYLWYPSGRRLLAHPWVKDAAIVQLYNTHGGYFSHRLLPDLARHAPVVWRLSDMWAMTGHCAYAGPCERWRDGCGHCPDLGRYPALPFDTTAFLWRVKQRTYQRARPTIVAPSRWLEHLARQSPLFAGCAVERIATGVDTSIHQPIDKASARDVLGFRRDGKLLLFSAHSVDDDERKGSTAAIAALSQVAPRDGLAVMLLGIGGTSWQGKLPHPITPLGFLRDERLLAAAYAAADLLIVPSSVENLPNSILEAMACGTPVVAFDTGGIGELVRHLETGWLAPHRDAGRLAEGIDRLIRDDAERARLARASVALIGSEFTAEREASAYLALYRRLLAERAKAAA